MGISIGIVGLPNVGKSTAFNALIRSQHAEAANYPFCTIEPNHAVVPVPDARLDKLSDLVKPEKTLYTTVEFVDIAGLVKGASQGEGLGNQFLGNIRESRAIIHIVRCFEDENITHVSEVISPLDDIEVINTELNLADIQTLENRIRRMDKQLRGDKNIQPLTDTAQSLLEHLEMGRPARIFNAADDMMYHELMKDTPLISAKPMIYVINVDEAGLADDDEQIRAVRKFADEENAEFVKLCAKYEEDLASMNDEERAEFMNELGLSEGGLEQIIRKGYHALGLISFFTAGPKEVRAWTTRGGSTAPQAAGEIHSDMERGFIRAEVISHQDYLSCGGETEAKAAGKMRLEGKDYPVRDGDVIYFRFSV
jgi:GTP-binding protein YchF